jgi:hypothetical protein
MDCILLKSVLDMLFHILYSQITHSYCLYITNFNLELGRGYGN